MAKPCIYDQLLSIFRDNVSVLFTSWYQIVSRVDFCNQIDLSTRSLILAPNTYHIHPTASNLALHKYSMLLGARNQKFIVL